MITVGIAELKARLSEYLRRVRRGHALIVVDRNTPIARVVPYESRREKLPLRKPLRRYASLQRVPLPPPLKLKTDPVALLLEERQLER